MVKISLGYEIYEKKSWELVRHKIFLTKIDNFSKKIGQLSKCCIKLNLVIFLNCRKFFEVSWDIYLRKTALWLNFSAFFLTSITKWNFPKKAEIFQHQREMFLIEIRKFFARNQKYQLTFQHFIHFSYAIKFFEEVF